MAALRYRNVIGLQFHPEKSQKAGMTLLKQIIEFSTCLKRFVGVITVKDRIAVQSIAFKKYLPIGDPVILAKT